MELSFQQRELGLILMRNDETAKLNSKEDENPHREVPVNSDDGSLPRKSSKRARQATSRSLCSGVHILLVCLSLSMLVQQTCALMHQQHQYFYFHQGLCSKASSSSSPSSSRYTRQQHTVCRYRSERNQPDWANHQEQIDHEASDQQNNPSMVHIRQSQQHGNKHDSQHQLAVQASQMASSIYKSDTVRNAQWKKLYFTPVHVQTTHNVKWGIAHKQESTSSNTTTSHSSSSSLWITIRGFDPHDQTVQRSQLLHQICGRAQPHKVTLHNHPDEDNGLVVSSLMVHTGLFEIAQAIYHDMKPFLQQYHLFHGPPESKLILCGHSIGGALSNLLLILFTHEYGSLWVQRHIHTVFTFGSPPVVRVSHSNMKNHFGNDRASSCPILKALQLPPTLVQGYVQPWDPIPRLFSNHDPIYPLVGEMEHPGIESSSRSAVSGYGISWHSQKSQSATVRRSMNHALPTNGATTTTTSTTLHGTANSMVHGPPQKKTITTTEDDSIYFYDDDDEHPQGRVLWPHGPPRLLRHVGFHVLYWAHKRFSPHFCWPQFRRDFQQTGNQSYVAVGVQHILTGSRNHNAAGESESHMTHSSSSSSSIKIANAWREAILPPSVHEKITLPHGQALEDSLRQDFPLTTFDISHVAEAVRSLIHHSHSSYGNSVQTYFASSSSSAHGRTNHHE